VHCRVRPYSRAAFDDAEGFNEPTNGQIGVYPPTSDGRHEEVRGLIDSTGEYLCAQAFLGFHLRSRSEFGETRTIPPTPGDEE